MTLLVLTTVAVAVGSWRFTLSLGLRRSTDTVTGWLVVLTSQLCLLVLAVGLAGHLRPGPLALAAGVVVALQVLWSLTGGRAAARRSARRVWAALGHPLRRARRHPIVLVLALLVLAQYLWRLAIAVRFPLLDHDGNYYHLISVDNWVQAEAVTHSPQVIFADVFPQNSELISAWSATFLHGTWFAGVTQFLFAAMGFAAVVGIASNAGAKRAAAVLAGLLFLATPIVFLQAGTGYVDVAASATVLATWQLLVSAYDLRDEDGELRRRVSRNFFVAGLGLGLMLGTKSSNVLAGALVALVAVFLLMAIRGKARVGRWATVPLCALLVPAALVGGYWYLRNLVTYGNPFWPVAVPFFEGETSAQALVLGGGVPAEIADLPPLTRIVRSWITDLLPHPYLFDQRLGGFGPQWTLMAPAIAVMIFGFLRDRLVYLLGLLIPFAVLFLLHPAAWWSRHTVFIAGLGAVCYVLAVQWLGGRWQPVLHVGLCLLVATGMWWSVSPTYLGASQEEPLSPSDALTLIGADEATRFSTRPPWSAYVELESAPRDSVIALPDRNTLHFTHPYVGTDLDRRLVVIPTPGDVGALHASLVDIGADYVVLGDDAQPTAALAMGALRDRDRFSHVGDTFEGLLFAVR